MCMDVFSPGCCIDIKLFLEQIWIEKSDDFPHKVGFTEVYDLCIYNCEGSPQMNELWLLFPHDYTQKDGDERTATIEILPMSPAVCEQYNDYEWAYDGPPERSNGGNYITRSFYSEPPSLGGRRHVTLKGKLLVAEDEGVGFPIAFERIHLEVLASPAIRKTLLHVKLKEPLHGGEQGWIRIIAHPQRLDATKPKQKLFPKIPDLLICEYRLVIQCPIIVRQMLDICLDNPDFNNPNIHNLCEHIRQIILTNGTYRGNTSTRITDHRLAVIATEDFDVCDTNCAGSMRCLGRVPPLEENDYTGILWHGGSNSNPQSDLLHNTRRVIDMVHHTGPKTKNELALALSPSGKHEAFCVLIDKMIDVKLLIPTSTQNPSLDLPKNLDRNAPCSDPRITHLRSVYSARSSDEQVGLLQEFTDLHPFRIDFRLKWFDDIS